MTLQSPHHLPQGSPPPLQNQTPSEQFKTVLFTDIDDTLIARGKHARMLKAAHDLHARLQADNIALILVTGASFATVETRIQNGELPLPDAVVAAVGTEIWLRNGQNWQPDDAYKELLERSGYKKSEVTLAASQFIAQARPGYELTFQPTNQGEGLKVSLHFMASHQDAAMLAQQASKFFAPYKVITCEEIHFNAALPQDSRRLKFCLDIVPSTKADAVSYLVNSLGIEHGFKAGDSGNDVDMLLNPDVLQPILVGGYKPEAHATIAQELTADSAGPLHTLQDGRTMYIEAGERVAAESLAHAISLLRGLVHGDVTPESI